MSKELIDKVFSKMDCVSIESNDFLIEKENVSIYLEKFLHSLNKLISPGDRIVILLDKEVYTPFLMLAIMKLNATFIPIDNKLPLERIRYIVEDSKCKLAIINDNSEFSNLGVEVITITDLMNLTIDKKVKISNNQENETAYIIYTSGSTGLPKGVKISYDSLCSFFECIEMNTDFDINTRFISLTSISFDISILEFLFPFVTGGYLFICSYDENSNFRKLRKKFIQKKINTTQLTPSRLLMLSNDIEFKKVLNTLNLILIGGENLTSELISNTIVNPKIKIYNLYGPTEATIWCSIKKIVDNNITIGKPFDNTLFHVKNEEGKWIKDIGIGELFLSGRSLLQGYTNSDLNFDRIVYDDSINEWLYKTGDIVEKMNNGEYRYIGRIDNQIKLNGYRVEVEEIESNIKKLKYINECCITYFERDEVTHLVCFISSTNIVNINEIIRDIQSYLSLKMPDYMIPKLFRFIEEFPTNINGKMDRRKMMEKTKYEFESPKIKKEIQKLVEQKIFHLINEEIGNEIDYQTLYACEDLNNIGLNSIGFIKLIVSIESEFNFEFLDDELIYGNLNTGEKIVSSVLKYMISEVNSDKANHIKAL